MDAHELARWTRFAGKGGIGKCTAIVDCIAQEMGEDLMFLKASSGSLEPVWRAAGVVHVGNGWMGTTIGDPRCPVILVLLGAYRGDCHRF